MSEQTIKTGTAESLEHHHFSPRIYGIVLLVAAIIVVGVWLISRFTTMDLARDMQAWQEKLNLIAESRSDEINKWVDGNFIELQSLANNPSLQLYMSELATIGQENKPANTSEEPAQKAYLRNLLLFTANRAGYSSENSLASIHANVEEESKGGLIVLNAKNDVVVSTPMSPATRAVLLANVKNFKRGKDGLIDIEASKGHAPQIGFTVPIFSIQSERNAEAQIGRVVGIKTIDKSFFDLLKHPGTIENTLEAVLVRKAKNKLEYISPLQDGTSALVKKTDFTPRRNSESSLTENTGDFISDKRDYRNKPVLATSRAIDGTPWTLIVKIDRREALSKSDQRRSSMIMFFFFIIAIIVLIIFAVWWHAHSKRAMMMSYHFKKLAAQSQAQEQLLRVVTDHQPSPTYILDMEQHFHFANKHVADEAHMSVEHVVGKTLNDVRGTARAERIAAQCIKAHESEQTIYGVSQLIDDGKEKIIRSAYVPLKHIPIAKLEDPTPGMLVVEQDISEVVHEREKRINTHNQLIQTLIKLVDRRDPFAADHSLLVSHVACEVAIDMELDNEIVDTARVAGSLMNIGKVVIPTELLTKNDSLTDAEKKAIQESMNVAAELVKDIKFDGPVADTLRQWQERWDGAGPLGMKGEDILVTARIIAVANAFIGMISPRSWRTAISIESANKFLLDQSDTVFDRKVVVALINYVENHKGHVWLTKMLAEKKKSA
ncbi:MAG: HD domain-containing phosphohydrolase [Rickettsiales bacterium]